MWPRKQPTIRQLLETVLANTRRIMSGVDDLKAAVAAIATDLTAEGVAIQSIIDKLKAGGLSDADAEALAVQLQGSAKTITDATTALNNALNPPPPGGSPVTK